MASTIDIKRRRVSIQSTQQITKAMKLVSTVKLQRAKTRAEQVKAYFSAMYETVNSMLGKVGHSENPYLKPGESKKKAVVVITSNRGLAGGYNSNVVKLLTQGDLPKEDLVIYAVGKKGRDALARYGYEIKEDFSDIIEEPQYPDAQRLCKALLEGYINGEFGEIYLAYTMFKNTVSHIPTLLKMLPVDPSDSSADAQAKDKGEEKSVPMNFEPAEDEALNLIIPKYVTSLVYGGLVEAVASENGARMQAMDNATSNAEEMIEELTLLFNRVRQGTITQELTEIIAGAEAIG